ncbi:internal scaffolding protein [Blackfly microvirus SF02]|uniref:Internal scaffolding protein n=1 Tax=Blackfly microvirus SF02 TaxID=2576452 RepID=A0A4P8PSK8_9VIRU|nr:internal scaffolding protein [Blackfly microvirus SF02]
MVPDSGRNTARERQFSVLVCLDPSKAVQSAKDETDINTIVKRFGLTGQLPQNVRTPLNMDFDAAFDFQSAMNLMVQADRAFMQMPADVRKRFGNDPAEFVNFASDPKNLEEARKLGLALPHVPVVEEPPVRVEVVAAPPPPPPKEK